MNAKMLYLGGLALPGGTHATILTGRDVVSGEMLAYPIVWADRPYGECPRCGQPVARVIDDCPASLNTGAGQGGAIQDNSQQHGCGLWLSVDWHTLPEDATAEAVLAAARELADDLKAKVDKARAKLHANLTADLQAALERLAEPLAEDESMEDREDQEVTTGSDVEPGVYRQGSEWVAWAYDPSGEDGETVTVSEEDLRAASDGQGCQHSNERSYRIGFAGAVYGLCDGCGLPVRRSRTAAGVRYEVAEGAKPRPARPGVDDDPIWGALRVAAHRAADEFYAIGAHYGFTFWDHAPLSFGRADRAEILVCFTPTGTRVDLGLPGDRHGAGCVDFPLDALADTVAVVAVGALHVAELRAGSAYGS